MWTYDGGTTFQSCRNRRKETFYDHTKDFIYAMEQGIGGSFFFLKKERFGGINVPVVTKTKKLEFVFHEITLSYTWNINSAKTFLFHENN